jgi:hypothetical protein
MSMNSGGRSGTVMNPGLGLGPVNEEATVKKGEKQKKKKIALLKAN